MSARLIRFCVAVALAGGAIIGASVAVDGAASAAVPIHVGATQSPVIDGFSADWLPSGLGSSVSDFSYSFDDVDFRSRVWESGPDDAGAYRQDLDIAVLRGPGLTSPRSLYRFLHDYEQRPPAQWRFVRFSVHGHQGYLGRDEAFWLVRPGVAIKVSVDRAQFTSADVVLVAQGIREARG